MCDTLSLHDALPIYPPGNGPNYPDTVGRSSTFGANSGGSPNYIGAPSAGGGANVRTSTYGANTGGSPNYNAGPTSNTSTNTPNVSTTPGANTTGGGYISLYGGNSYSPNPGTGSGTLKTQDNLPWSSF
jgi:hypothetical protein